MPFPLIPAILGGVSLLFGTHGIKKGLDAKHDLDAAKSINNDAQSIAKKAEDAILNAKDTTTKAIEALGSQKVDILSSSIHDFVTTFGKIRNIELNSSEGLEELKNFHPQSPEFLRMKEVSIEAKELAVNGIGAIGGGALLAFGTYNIVMGGLGGLLVTATTGTALTSLTGVAATNATLAWLGGGALSVGGLGMAGGMAVLGGLVVGPALALGGSMFAKQADKAYWDAKSNLEKAKEFKEQANNILITLNAIASRANQLKLLLTNLNKPFISLIADMRSIVRNHGDDWSNYSDADRKQIYKCVQVAQVIKMILDTSLLKEDGSLQETSKKAVDDGNKFLSSLTL